jgi:hypothetical protein
MKLPPGRYISFIETLAGRAKRPNYGGMIGCSKKEVKEQEMTYYEAPCWLRR